MRNKIIMILNRIIDLYILLTLRFNRILDFYLSLTQTIKSYILFILKYLITKLCNIRNKFPIDYLILNYINKILTYFINFLCIGYFKLNGDPFYINFKEENIKYNSLLIRGLYIYDFNGLFKLYLLIFNNLSSILYNINIENTSRAASPSQVYNLSISFLLSEPGYNKWKNYDRNISIFSIQKFSNDKTFETFLKDIYSFRKNMVHLKPFIADCEIIIHYDIVL